jgi:hypothetical protein
MSFALLSNYFLCTNLSIKRIFSSVVCSQVHTVYSMHALVCLIIQSNKLDHDDLWSQRDPEILVCLIYMSAFLSFKRGVQQDVKRNESKLKQSVLKSYITRKIYFQNLKDCHHERSIKPVSAS